MTEVASLLPANHRLTTVRHYEAGPPPELSLVEPGESIALTKEEEWISKKKTEVTNTKQIETRVKRQVVLEDGKVVEDSGPMVTTNTTEDTETQEHHQTELRKLGDDEVDHPLAVEGGSKNGKRNWVVTTNPDGLVREVKEKRVLSREETEEIKETEDVQHFGDITDEAFLAAVRSGHRDIRKVLRANEGGKAVVSTGPRVVHESIKSKKVIDTEDKRDLSSVQPDGKIVTESQRTTEHEEILDDELPEDAPVRDTHKESSERYLKTRDQLDVDYLADGVHVGHEMRFRTENVEVEKRGDGVGLDDPDFDSLSARLRRRGNANNRPQHRYQRGLETLESPLDRKEALTGRPIDFDKEEETRKVETSKWLEHHFGSDSKSSKSSIIDEEEQPPKTSFFNVTIKSQPSRNVDSDYSREYSTPARSSPRIYSPQEPERDEPSRYFKGISDWSERRQEQNFVTERRSPIASPIRRFNERTSPLSPIERPLQRSPIPDYRETLIDKYKSDQDSSRDYREEYRETYREERDNRKIYRDQVHEDRSYRSNYENGYNGRQSPSELYSKVIKTNGKIHHDDHYTNGKPNGKINPDDYFDKKIKENGKMRNEDYKPVRENGTLTRYKDDYKIRENGKIRDDDFRGSRENILKSNREDYRSIDRRVYRSRTPENITPVPPHRKRSSEKRQRGVEERRHENGYRRTPPKMDGPMEEPPPDYSPPSPVSAQKDDRKAHQKTRFADEQPKQKSGNIIGQSIRKLVGKIRSASAERKAKQKAKRSPSPTYQSGQVIDANIMENGKPPIQRYYLGEDPFAGSIYGRENKYDGVKPARSSRKPREEELRSHSTTLGRFSKSTSRLPSNTEERKNSQTLPRHLSRHEPPVKLERNNKSNSTINVSIINTVSSPKEAPAKPSRTFKTNLPRSKSFSINEDFDPGRRMYRSTQHINRLNESHTGLKSPGLISSLSRSNRNLNEDYRYRNGDKRIYLKNVKDRNPDMYKTLHESDDNSTSMKTSLRTRNYHSDYNESPTRLRDTYGVSSVPINTSSIKSGSNSSDFSETYHTTTRNDDPLRPSVTNTTKTFTKKTIPSKDGRSFETIESSETRSITKSHYRDPIIKYSDSDRRYRGASPVVIEVRNNNYRK